MPLEGIEFAWRLIRTDYHWPYACRPRRFVRPAGGRVMLLMLNGIEGAAVNPDVLFNLIVLSGAAGFAAYCGSYAFHVWRARNVAVAGSAQADGAARRGWMRCGVVAVV